MSKPPPDRLRPHPESRFAPAERWLDLNTVAEELRREPPARGGHRQRTIYKHGTMAVALFVFEAGSSLPRHTTRGTVLIQVLEGQLEVQTPQQTHALGPGQLAILAPDVPHDVRARSSARMLLTVQLDTPSPPAP